jgi:hypothetical protein
MPSTSCIRSPRLSVSNSTHPSPADRAAGRRARGACPDACRAAEDTAALTLRATRCYNARASRPLERSGGSA